MERYTDNELRDISYCKNYIDTVVNGVNDVYTGEWLGRIYTSKDTYGVYTRKKIELRIYNEMKQSRYKVFCRDSAQGVLEVVVVDTMGNSGRYLAHLKFKDGVCLDCNTGITTHCSIEGMNKIVDSLRLE